MSTDEKTPYHKKIYNCENCDFNTTNKKDYKRHLNSKKHNRGGTKKSPFFENKDICFRCDKCNNVYKYRSGLARHFKKCEKHNKGSIIEIHGKIWGKKSVPVLYPKNDTDFLPQASGEEKLENKELEKAKLKIVDLELKLKSKEIGTLKKELLHKDEIIDIYKKQAKEGKHITYNNCNNKNLTVNVYLTEHCKNAMNLTDFVKQIQVQLEDVMYQKDFGAVAGIQNILQKQLGNLAPTDRPIHCTDEKRMQFYVKEDDKWEKDIGDKAAQDIRTEIKNKSVSAMKEWEDANPYFADKPKLQDEYNNIIHGILEGYGDKKKFAKQIQEVKKRVASMVRIQDAMKDEIVDK